MDPEINASHKQPLSAEQRKRNELERVVGSGKRKYAPNLNMARLVKGAETSISMASLVMCAEKIRSLLCLFWQCISLVLLLAEAWLHLDGTYARLAD